MIAVIHGGADKHVEAKVCADIVDAVVALDGVDAAQKLTAFGDDIPAWLCLEFNVLVRIDLEKLGNDGVKPLPHGWDVEPRLAGGIGHAVAAAEIDKFEIFKPHGSFQ
ncbi:hypothetical protein SDC9_68586 [bioreactor metagenome]|uniref:Uncharacterized protein n=1 Tax=bioreactor metagenome TaxID=1076179 RepID=A0A644Y0U4_9ZZZZ